MSRRLELDRSPVPAATVLIRGARLLDPRADLDGCSSPPPRAPTP